MPLWIPCRLQEALTRRESLFSTASEFLSLFPGYPGILLRRGFYHATLHSMAPDASLGFGTTIPHTEIRIGHGVSIGNHCTIGKVVIEDHVTIGSNVDVLSGRHQHHFDDPDRPIQEQGGSYIQIRVGRNSWIGNSAVILADVGENCVIGAGAVVVRPIPDQSVAAGNPARVIRTILQEDDHLVEVSAACQLPAEARLPKDS